MPLHGHSFSHFVNSIVSHLIGFLESHGIEQAESRYQPRKAYPSRFGICGVKRCFQRNL